MLYEPPTKWTEEDLLKLSGEDDRYEFKSGKILLDGKTNAPLADDELSNKLAVEICAFANSFGGTLFLGVKDKNKGIDGIDKLYKGNSKNPLKEWLDKKINHLLEFRLPQYRVTEVQLSTKTLRAIGEDKTVVAIDVYDSDLAPHQAKFDHKYYYRQSSNSNPAPHHYLAYLWSRTSEQQSIVVNKWCVEFLNHTIGMIVSTAELVKKNELRNYDNRVLYTLDAWDNHFKSLTADQFLRTFPNINNKCVDFKQAYDEFYDRNFQKLVATLVSSDILEKAMRKYVGVHLDHYPSIQVGTMPYLELLKYVCDITGISHFPNDEVLAKIANLVALALLGTSDGSVTTEDQVLWRQCIAHFKEAVENKLIIRKQVNQARKKIDDIQKNAFTLAIELADFRYQLCLKHNTSY